MLVWLGVFQWLPARFVGDTTAKLKLSWQGMAVTWEHPFFGAGRGAFSDAFVRHFGVYKRFSYPESLPIQWASEWGLPLATLLLVSVSFVLLSVLIQSRSSTRQAATAGLLSLGIHNIVDFSFELLGISLVVVALLGNLATNPHHQRVQNFSINTTKRLGFLLSTVGLVAALALLVYGKRWDRQNLQDQLLNAYDAPLTDFEDKLGPVLLQYPAEPAFYVIAGAKDLRDNGPDAFRLLNRAMVLAPGWPIPHLLVAQWLYEHHFVHQALLEIRETASRHPSMTYSLICRIAKETADVNAILKASPQTAFRVDFLDQAAGCLPPTEQALLDEKILERYPEHPAALLRKAHRLVYAVNQDVPAAVRILDKLNQTNPSYEPAWIAHVELLNHVKQPKQALAVAEKAKYRIIDRARLLRAKANSYGELGDFEAMRSVFFDLARYLA
ncbi:MAG: hypothetical protein IPJ88_13020 [Myxococcales bacterium]|nr:MAG: hypothetical protein IPJ88_13020 [Myxococcales bacterium]